MPPMVKGKTQLVPFEGPDVVVQVESDALVDLDPSSFSPDVHESLYICFWTYVFNIFPYLSIKTAFFFFTSLNEANLRQKGMRTTCQ